MTASILLCSLLLAGTASGVKDWLITNVTDFPEVTLTNCTYNSLPCIELSNSLISRKFITSPNFFTVEYNSYLTEPFGAVLRTLTPEAIVGLNNVNYSIGGVSYKNLSANSQYTWGFFDSSWIEDDNLQVNNTAFTYESYQTNSTLYKPYNWVPGTRSSPTYIPWPPLGLALETFFKPPVNSSLDSNLRVVVRYELFQGMPIMSKQVKITSLDPSKTQDVHITYVEVERLGTNVPFSPSESSSYFDYWSTSPNAMLAYSGLLWIETDTPHMPVVSWYQDPNLKMYKSMNYGAMEPMVSAYMGVLDQQTDIDIRLAPELPGTYNGTFESFRVFEVFLDTIGDLERFGMSRQRLMSYLTPATLENPIYTQTTNLSNASLYRIIDQCAELGFELLAFSFGCGFDLETTNETQLEYYQNVISYAVNEAGIEIGGYDLVDMGRNISEYNRVELDGTNKEGLCYATQWSNEIIDYYNNFLDFGMSMIITDGPYPGWSCASTEHKFHENLGDSVFRQLYLECEFYRYMQNENVFIHQPDEYFYFGGNRDKYPYNEFTFTLPRFNDLTISRQLMYDTSYVRMPTSGWMFLPSIPYHNGSADSIFEPLAQNIDDYDWALGMYFNYAVAPTIRGYELYDNNSTYEVVKKWVDYYKSHRQILISSIYHLRRPDNQWIDAILHVNHLLDECGLASIFNPLEQSVTNAEIKVNLYYTGAKGSIWVSEADAKYEQVTLEDEYYYTLNVTMSPRSITYFVFSCDLNTNPNLNRVATNMDTK